MGWYRKSYLCVCEGQQEELYLKHIAFLLKNFPERVVTFNPIVGNSDKLNKVYTEYDSAVLFDYDFNETKFRNNILICDKLRNANRPTKRKKGKKVFHAYSNVNFDLWLILHKEDYNKPVYKNNAYINDVRRIYGLNSDDDIKNKNVIEKILSQITKDDVKKAIKRAKNIRDKKIDEDKIVIGSTVCYSNPDFSIDKFLEFVFIDCNEM